MIELYFLRHGIATAKGSGPDEERPLVDEGRQKTKMAAQVLKRMDIEFDAILTSPWTRARQTADIVVKILKAEERLQEMEELAGRPAEEMVNALTKHQGKCLLLVGHQPQMGEAIAHLLGAEGSLDVDLKKSGICMVAVDALPPRSPGVLQWMISPKHFKLML